MESAARAGSTSRGLSPSASGRVCAAPASPSSASSVPAPAAARLPMVANPASRSRSAVFGPTPHIRSTGNGARNAATSSGTTTRPSGLSRSLAIFAANLHGATPAEAARPSLGADLVLYSAGRWPRLAKSASDRPSRRGTLRPPRAPPREACSAGRWRTPPRSPWRSDCGVPAPRSRPGTVAAPPPSASRSARRKGAPRTTPRGRRPFAKARPRARGGRAARDCHAVPPTRRTCSCRRGGPCASPRASEALYDCPWLACLGSSLPFGRTPTCAPSGRRGARRSRCRSGLAGHRVERQRQFPSDSPQAKPIPWTAWTRLTMWGAAATGRSASTRRLAS